MLINAPLVKGMKPMANAKAPASVIMFLISSVDEQEERAMHMFRWAGRRGTGWGLLCQVGWRAGTGWGCCLGRVGIRRRAGPG